MKNTGKSLAIQIILSNIFCWVTLGIYPLIIGIKVLCNLDKFKPQNKKLAIIAGIFTLFFCFLIFPGLILGAVLNSKECKSSNY